MYDRLKADRAAWKNGDLEMGGRYYREMRQKYSSPECIEKKLVVTTEGDQIDEQLSSAFTALALGKTQIHEFLDWADNVSSVNNLCMVAVYRQLVKHPPVRSASNASLGMAAMKLTRRLGLHETYPQLWGLMKGHFDSVLVASWNAFRVQGRPLSFWWRANKQAASLLLPEMSVEATMAAEEQWVTVSEHVHAVYNSSSIGRILMERAMGQVNMEKATTMMNELIGELEKDGVQEITVPVLTALRGKFVKEMQRRGFGATKPYQRPRDIERSYRGVVIRVMCQSPMDSFNIRVACRVRGLAVDVLTPLWCENDLVASPRPKPKVKVHPAVVSECLHFRESALGLLSTSEATGPNIEDLVKRKGGFFQGLDRACRVELSFWASSIGEKARERVQAAIQACLPQVGRTLTLPASLAALDQLGDSKLMVFAGAAMQSTFKVTQGFVGSLKLGAAPALEKAGDSPFMAVAKARLGLLLMMPPPVGQAAAGSAQGVVTKYGREAAAQHWAEIKASWEKDKGTVSYAAVSNLQAFSWLLQKAEQGELRKVGSAIVAMKSEGPSGPAKKVKKGAAAGASAQSMVAALFTK